MGICVTVVKESIRNAACSDVSVEHSHAMLKWKHIKTTYRYTELRRQVALHAKGVDNEGSTVLVQDHHLRLGKHGHFMLHVSGVSRCMVIKILYTYR